MAVKVAGLNGVYVDGTRDVSFGRRSYNTAGKKFVIEWNKSPYNVVRVDPKMNNSKAGSPDAQLNLFFATIFGKKTQSITASAAAYVESRDLVLTLDYSGSMNDDSTYVGFAKLGKSAVESNMWTIYNILNPNVGSKLPNTPAYLVVTDSTTGSNITTTFKGLSADLSANKNITKVVTYYSNGSTKTTTPNSKTTTVTSTNGYPISKVVLTSNNKTVTVDDDYDAVKTYFGLDKVSYPFPGGSWDEFIYYSRYNGSQWDAGYGWQYGKLTFLNYVLEYRQRYVDTPKLQLTPHYPFHAMKNGVTQFTTFLQNLDFGDQLGLVDYATTARVETDLNDPVTGTYVSLGGAYLTTEFNKINTIQVHKQAGHYDSTTAIGRRLEHGTRTAERPRALRGAAYHYLDDGRPGKRLPLRLDRPQDVQLELRRRL